MINMIVGDSVSTLNNKEKKVVVNLFALIKAKILYNFGLSESKRV